MTPTGYDAEREFLREYRGAGLAWARYACIAGIVLVVMFLMIPSLSARQSYPVVAIRIAMLAMLIATFSILNWRPVFAADHYVIVLGGCSFVILFGIATIVAVPGFGQVTPGFSPIPAVLFALFLHYGFLRLPVRLVTLLCLTFSVTVVVVTPTGFEGVGALRILLYLVAVNTLGYVLTRSIELRERELFTQRRRAEAAQAEVERRARAAEEAHQEKTRLLAAVSHDLRQPMVAAVFQLSALRSGLEKGDLARATRQAARLEESVDTLGATLDHLLTAARYDSGTEPIRIGLVELNPVLRRLEQAFASDAAAKGIELRVRVPESPLLVTSDAMTLWRVLLNLVSNAVKFTHSEGRRGRGVLVKVRVRNGVCRIDVADTGDGIAPQFLQEIWQPYFQVANAERNRERGLGLGLFLVRRALDHLPNHQLSLRSKPKRGSRFTLTLPGHWSHQAEVVDEPTKGDISEGIDELRGAYLMLIEDDRDARRAIEELFTEWGAVFSSGASLSEVLEDDESATRLVDAVISDYRLPGERDGIDSVVALRTHLGMDIPAVIITGESDLASIRRRAPDSVSVLQKPFSVADFARPIVDAVRAARRREGT